MSLGKVVQIIGAVVDIEFSQDNVPAVYDALKVTDGDLAGLTLEVQQQLGGGVVRTIALGTTDGLRRGASVENTGEAIKVPVGTEHGTMLRVKGRGVKTSSLTGDLFIAVSISIPKKISCDAKKALEVLKKEGL